MFGFEVFSQSMKFLYRKTVKIESRKLQNTLQDNDCLVAEMETEKFEDIVEDFAFLDDWQERYGYVIDLGKRMQGLDDVLKVSATKVSGCASQVWMVAEVDHGKSPPRFRFQGDSDALIVRGLIAILKSLYNGQSPEAVLNIDAFGELGRLDLQSHLSSQRSNGLTSMVARIREMAGSFVSSNGSRGALCGDAGSSVSLGRRSF